MPIPAPKYFIAIIIPEPHLGEIEEIKKALYRQYGLKGGLRSPAHITLHRPFEWKEAREGELIETLKQFSFTEGFPITLRDFGFFVPRVIFVAVEESTELPALHDALKRFARTQLRLTNEDDDERGFHPHVTVAFRDLKKKDFVEVSTPFRDRRFEATFSYPGFSLLKLDNHQWSEIAFFPHRT